MKKTSIQLLCFGLLTLALAGGNATNAAETTKKKPEVPKTVTETPKAKRDWYPFYGTVAAVDQKAKTISLKKKEGERVLKLGDKSELEINGKPATIADVKVGNYAHGTLNKDSSGAEIIKAAKFDKEPPQKGEPEKSAAAPIATEVKKKKSSN